MGVVKEPPTHLKKGKSMILRKDYEATFKEGFRLGVRLTRAKECYVRATDARALVIQR